MIFSNYSSHVTPLYKNLNVLKLNNTYRLELAKFIPKLHHGALPKIFDNFFKNISNIYSYKTSFADNQKKVFFRGAAFWKEIEQSLKILPYVTFCKHYKDRLLNYEKVFAQPYMIMLFNGEMGLLNEYDANEISFAFVCLCFSF